MYHISKPFTYASYATRGNYCNYYHCCAILIFISFMEPFARRPIERIPVRRPVMGVPARPAAPQPATAANPTPMAASQSVKPMPTATPVTPHPRPTHAQPTAQPSLLQPPSFQSAGPRIDIQPTAAARPMAAQPSGPTRPLMHHPAHHPKPLPQPSPAHHPVHAPSAHHQPHHPATTAHPAVSQTTTHPTHATHTPTHHGDPEHPHYKTAESHNTKHHKEFHAATHAGLVGFITFLVVGALFLAPLLPGKIWQNAPGSSESFSTGDQSLDCLSTLGPITTTSSYDHKIGFPLTYDYSTTSKLSATCEGKTQHAVGGHTSQFSPVALLINFILALGIAIAAAKIWRKLRIRKD